MSNTAPVAAASTQTARSQRLYNRNLTVSELTVKTDKHGRPYANFRGGFTDKKSGKQVSIFCQAFGKSYEALKDVLVEGNTIKVFGAHERREANPEQGIQATRSFRVVGLSKPRTQEQAAA